LLLDRDEEGLQFDRVHMRLSVGGPWKRHYAQTQRVAWRLTKNDYFFLRSSRTVVSLFFSA
jgi:hypothetical protein